MTYIWNRMNKVNSKLMPKVVEDAFDKWVKEQLKGFKELTDERKTEVTFTILKQMGNMNYNLKQLGYIK
jgi:hypothetical protein